MNAIIERKRPAAGVLLPALGLCVVGLVGVSSAAPSQGGSALLTRQLLAMGVGLAALFFLFVSDYRRLLRYSFALYVGSLLPLLYLLTLGRAIAHVRSWIRFGGLQFQPAELAKITTALLVAYLFENDQEPRLTARTLAKLFAIVGVPFLLVFLQPDLGEALTFLPYVAAGMFFGRAPRRYWVALGLVAALAAGGTWLALKDYQRQRIATFLHPRADVEGAGYQVQQSKIAVGSGGLFGKGYRRGTQSQLRFLPVRHTDFILAVLAEEWGFVGVLVVLVLYGTMVSRSLAAASHARDRGGAFLAACLASTLAFSGIVNSGMMIGILPTTGIPLPLVSYGGSSAVATLAAIGLLLSVEARRFANA